MFHLPRYLVARAQAQGDLEYQRLIEWRLSTFDVADLFGVTTKTVWNWTVTGRRGHRLPFRTFTRSYKSPRAFRLLDVQMFADGAKLGIDYAKLHPALQREWGVGPLARDHAEPDTVVKDDNIRSQHTTQRESTQRESTQRGGTDDG